LLYRVFFRSFQFDDGVEIGQAGRALIDELDPVRVLPDILVASQVSDKLTESGEGFHAAILIENGISGNEP